MARLKFHEEIAAPRAEAFALLTDVGRLAELLGPEVGVRVMHRPADLRRGAEAHLELTRFGLAQTTRWRIEDVLMDSSLTFRQVEGIFASWTHTLRFADWTNGTTLVTEEIRFGSPGGPLGRLVDQFLVGRELERLLRRRLRRAAEALKPILGS